MWFNQLQLQLQSISLLAATSASCSLSFKSFEGKVKYDIQKATPISTFECGQTSNVQRLHCIWLMAREVFPI